MNVREIFAQAGPKLFYQRLPDEHAIDETPGQAIEPDQAYLVVRMKEMYLARTRILWRKQYPVLYGYFEHGGVTDRSVAGPGQLRELGDLNLERVINLNYRLTGPTPYRGEDMVIAVGLYAVPGQDASKALIDAVTSLSALGGIAAAQVADIATVVRNGVDAILGLDSTRLQLGVHDTLPGGRPLQPGFYVGIAAEVGKVDVDQLWLRGGRLWVGEGPYDGRPYDAYDYMVLAVERLESRPDWPRLHAIAAFQQEFTAVMAGSEPPDRKQEKLAQAWPRFQEALNGSPDLTAPDRLAIALSVSEDLKARLEAQRTGNPFEARGLPDATGQLETPEHFDLAAVPDYLDRSDATSLRTARVALEQDPFV